MEGMLKNSKELFKEDPTGQTLLTYTFEKALQDLKKENFHPHINILICTIISGMMAILENGNFLDNLTELSDVAHEIATRE